MKAIIANKSKKSNISSSSLLIYGIEKGLKELSIEVRIKEFSLINRIKSMFEAYTFSFSIYPVKPFPGRKKVLFIFTEEDFNFTNTYDLNVFISGGENYKGTSDKKIMRLIPGGDQLNGVEPLKPNFKLPDKFLFFCGKIKYKRELSSMLNVLSAEKELFDYKIVVSSPYDNELAIFMNEIVKKGIYEKFVFIGDISTNEFLYILTHSDGFINLSPTSENLIYTSIAINHMKPVILEDKESASGFDMKMLFDLRTFLEKRKSFSPSNTKKILWKEQVRKIIETLSWNI